jgi:DNA-directed RNA polymerase subunit RPC12/RpoP
MRIAAPALPNEQCWVAVRCGFTCNSCRFLAPLDSLDADGAAECAHCGLRQRFDADNWRPGLAFAHSVADLAGPNLEGRSPHPAIWIGSDNPYAAVGDTTTFEQYSGNELSVDAAPGYPVCAQCREPLRVALAEPGACHTQCPRCGERASYKLADGARALYSGLLACVSDDARSDRPRVRAQATAAGITLVCASCGAPMNIENKSPVQTCRYCQASCIVPLRNAQRALHAAVEPSIWWLLLRGASPKRSELQTGTEAESSKASKLAALKLFKGGGSKVPIGDEPGVYEAPEVTGWNLTQMAFTVLLGLLALLLAFGVTRFIPIQL